jgi:hypothetical protein
VKAQIWWFGDSWGAPVCVEDGHAPTPSDVYCAHGCGHSIRPGDQGVLLPVSLPLSSEGLAEVLMYGHYEVNGVAHVAYHLVCFFDEIGVRGVTHH